MKKKKMIELLVLVIVYCRFIRIHGNVNSDVRDMRFINIGPVNATWPGSRYGSLQVEMDENNIVIIGGFGCDGLRVCQPSLRCPMHTHAMLITTKVVDGITGMRQVMFRHLGPQQCIINVNAAHNATMNYATHNWFGRRIYLAGYKATSEEVVFGTGEDVLGNFYGDFWAFNVSSELYRVVNRTSLRSSVYVGVRKYSNLNRMSMRSGSVGTVVMLSGIGMIFGGGTVDIALHRNEFWLLNYTTAGLEFVLIAHQISGMAIFGQRNEMNVSFVPRGRRHAMMITNKYNGQIYLYGGGLFADLWRINATSDNIMHWTQGWIAGASPLIASRMVMHSETDYEYHQNNQAGCRSMSSEPVWLTHDTFAFFSGEMISTFKHNRVVEQRPDLWLFNITNSMFMFQGTREIGWPGNIGTINVFSIDTWPRGRTKAHMWKMSSTHLMLFGGGGYDQIDNEYSNEIYLVGVYSCFGKNLLDPSVCSAAGICVNQNRCVCKNNNSALLVDCSGIYTCGTCFGHGKCVLNNKCECNDKQYYSGEFCENWMCYNSHRSDMNVCNAHGACVAHNKCNCFKGYVGEKCDTYECFDDKGCENNGQCIAPNICRCPQSTFGDRCEYFGCANISSASNTVCSGMGKCMRENQCVCSNPVLWHGETCSISTYMIEAIVITGIVVCCVIATSIISCVFISCYYVQQKKLSRLREIADIELVVEECRVTKNMVSLNKNVIYGENKIKQEDVKIIRKIGNRGGSGAFIWLAEWNGQLVAYKMFDSSTLDFDMFNRELNIMMSLRHPNILQCYGAVIATTSIGYLMEYAQKGDLVTFIRNEQQYRQLTSADKFRLMLDVAYGLEHMHSRNIIHRDVKPENVLVTNGGVAKLMDFGLSRINVDKTKTLCIGTPMYMAPEIVSGKGDYTMKADVYSFGVMIMNVINSNDDNNQRFRCLLDVVCENRPTMTEVIKLIKEYCLK